MKYPSFKFSILSLFLLVLSTTAKADVFDGIEVATRTSDSTGHLSLSSVSIQQSIILTIPALSGMNLNAQQPTLLVTPATAYLLLKGTDSTGQSVNVAIQLLNKDSSFIYKVHSKMVVHICKNVSGCNNCQFVQLANMIVSCKCSDQSAGTTGCTNSTIWLK